MVVVNLVAFLQLPLFWFFQTLFSVDFMYNCVGHLTSPLNLTQHRPPRPLKTQSSGVPPSTVSAHSIAPLALTTSRSTGYFVITNVLLLSVMALIWKYNHVILLTLLYSCLSTMFLHSEKRSCVFRSTSCWKLQKSVEALSSLIVISLVNGGVLILMLLWCCYFAVIQSCSL